jgi:putative nucleotidyltransferase-like protein
MNRRRFWPDPAQASLLGFCLLRDPSAAVRAWHEWKTRVRLDDLDHGSFQIMSLVHNRLLELGVADPDLPRIKGLYRFQWAQAQLDSRGARELLRALHREGFPSLLLQGAALGQTVYPDPSTRGVADMEVAVPRDAAAGALTRLATLGWVAESLPDPRALDWTHGCRLVHPVHGAAQLCWRILRAPAPAGCDVELWRAARPLVYEQVPTQMLCAADQFLQASEQGTFASASAGPQWLVDCAFVLRHSPSPFDWARLIDQAARVRLVPHLPHTVRYLRRTLEPAIPAEAVASLNRLPVRLDERIAYFLAGRPEEKQRDLTHKWAMTARRYVQLKPDEIPSHLRRDIPRLLRLLAGRAQPARSSAGDRSEDNPRSSRP